MICSTLAPSVGIDVRLALLEPARDNDVHHSSSLLSRHGRFQEARFIVAESSTDARSWLAKKHPGAFDSRP
jgi:hypothetical protein